jgi:deoxycytidine triphosphate deaminase
MEPNEDMLLDESVELEHENYEPPEDQTVLSDSDLLDKLADFIELVGKVEIVNMPSELTARLALRQSLARL